MDDYDLMRQSSRLNSPHVGNARTGPVRGPDTPHRPRPRNALDELIASLEADYQLGFLIRDETWSPKKTTGSLGDKVQRRIRQLFYTSRSTLDQALQEFKVKAERLPLPNERLTLLDLLLRVQPLSPLPARVTRSQTLREQTNQSSCGKPGKCAPKFRPRIGRLNFVSSPALFIRMPAASRTASRKE